MLLPDQAERYQRSGRIVLGLKGQLSLLFRSSEISALGPDPSQSLMGLTRLQLQGQLRVLLGLIELAGQD